MNIIVFYHGLFMWGEPPEVCPAASGIIHEQMDALKQSGLEDAASEIYCGINGGDESSVFSQMLPAKAMVVYHGLKCRNENRTIQLIEERVKKGDEFYACYFHTKGAQFPEGDGFRSRWRRRMQHNIITHWKNCVKILDAWNEACGCHWLTPESYPGLVSKPYFAGTFFWARSSYLKTLPPIAEAPTVKQHGIDAFESRYSAESWIGTGPTRPRIFDFAPGWPS